MDDQRDEIPSRSARAAYVARINRVLDHVGANLAQPLDLAALAGVAHFSPWHFHRTFHALTGETVADCVRRMRLEAAAQRLVSRPEASALSIALDVGFASAEVFSRAFKAQFGMTPTAWRRGGWRAHARLRGDELSKIHQERRKASQAAALALRNHPEIWPAGPVTDPQGLLMNVELTTLPPMRLAYMRYTGPYGTAGITQTWERFGAWCAAQGLMNPQPRMYGLSLDDPDITAPDKCRYDCCVAVGDAFRPHGEVGVQAFAGGQYAFTRFTGTGADIHQAWMDLFGRWLPQSGWQADDKPCVEIYEEDFCMDPKTGRFGCLLAVPVRAM